LEPGAEEWQDAAVLPRWRILVTLAWFLASAMLLVGPGFAVWGNAATPRVAGLPWSHAWVWGIVVANFLVLVLLHASRWLDRELDGVATPDDSRQGLRSRAAAGDASRRRDPR